MMMRIARVKRVIAPNAQAVALFHSIRKTGMILLTNSWSVLTLLTPHPLHLGRKKKTIYVEWPTWLRLRKVSQMALKPLGRVGRDNVCTCHSLGN